MSRKFLPVVFVIAVLSAAIPLAGAPEDGYQRVEITLPAGDAAAGRETFVELSCTTCHAVRGEDDLPRPVAQLPVPVLGKRHAKMSPSKLATAIVTPSHQVSDEVLMKSRTPTELSPMGDFTEAMTVRQLADLIAFLRSIKDDG